jgi:hypothetical protein
VDNSSANYAHLGNCDYPLVRAKLRAWLVLEDFYNKILEAAGKGNREEFVSSIYSYVSAAFIIPKEDIYSCPWYEVTRAFRQIYETNRPSFDFPILQGVEDKENDIDWDYIGRDWFVWLHLLAGKYGWNVEYIENLDVDDGLALIEEIMVDKQMEKEWQWSMSEIAYPYNEQTKKSIFHPLERPAWMRGKPKPAKKVKIKASMLPVGTVLKWDTDKNEYTRPQ